MCGYAELTLMLFGHNVSVEVSGRVAERSRSNLDEGGPSTCVNLSVAHTVVLDDVEMLN